MLMISRKQTLLYTLILIGTFWTADALFAQTLMQIPQSRTPLPQVPQNQTDSYTGSMYLPLTQMTPNTLEQALRQVCGHRFVSESSYQYTFSTNRNNNRQRSLLRIDTQSNRAVLSGDKQLCDQILQLITAIDQSPPQGKRRQIIPYQNTPPEVIAKALDAYRIQRPARRNDAAVRPMNPTHPIQQVTYQFQEGGLFDSGGINSAVQLPRNDMSGLLQSGDPAAIGVVDEFRYKILSELDVMVLDADGARLNQIVAMIRELEELSKLNKPNIEVIYLKYVNNVALGEIFRQENGAVYTDIFKTVQGAVRFIPMTSPNAILLIGWGDAMTTAKELVAALDLPTATENSRLHFFKLKHTSANNARAALAGAFPVPPGQPSGFMARIQLFADQRSNTLIVQAAPNDLEEVKRVLNEIDVPAAAPKLQVQTVRLKHTLAPDLESTLNKAIAAGTTDGKFPALELLIQGKEGQKFITSGIMSDVSISTDVRNNQMIVKAPESCMTFIKELIDLLDIASPEAEIKIFQIEHGDANSLVEMLTKLIPTNVHGTPGPQLPGAANEETLIPIRFAIDVRANCIVAAGSPGDLKVVEALVQSLDREDQLARQEIVYPLKNMKAIPVAATINKYITTRLEVQANAPGVISNYQQIESAVIVVPDETSNSLIISATPKYYDEVMKLIKEIDKSLPQVVIKVLVVEVTLSEDKEWAAELGLQDPLLFTRSAILGTTDPFNISNGPGMLFNNPTNSLANINTTNPVGKTGTLGTQVLSNFGAGRVGQAGFGGMVFSVSSDYINIMLRALHEKKRLEVLSSPQITTMNNVKSTISVGQIVPRYKGTVTAQNGTTTQNIDDQEVALELGITPTISPEGTIVMGMALKKEKIGPEIGVGEAGSMSTIDKASLATMVSAANNQTVILGGLITNEANKIRRKVPLLGDIPLLGKFFRQEVDQKVRKELLVILTPRIIHQGQDDMEQVKQMEYARMSWCLTNVVEVYGDIGAYNVIAEHPYTGDAPIVTPGPVKMEDLQPILAPTLPTPVLPRRE